MTRAKPRVEVDVERGTVRIDALQLDGQWVVFYALLCLGHLGLGPSLVDAGLLHEHTPWSAKRATSVGKEVARHLEKLGPADAPPVHAGGRTVAWSIAPGAEVVLHPNPRVVGAWCSAQRTAGEVAPRIERVRRLVEAEVALQRGQIDDAEVQCKGFDRISAWELWVEARRCSRLGDLRAIESLEVEARGRVDVLGRAVRRRILASRALTTRFDEADAMVARLARESEQGVTMPDVATGAVLDNVRAVLLRRSGRLDEATDLHLYALPAFGVVGDVAGLQACLFNIGLCLGVRSAGTAAAARDRAALEVVELALAVCEAFSLGDDSAQGEILAARWSARLGESARARRWLERAERLTSNGASDYDLACFLRARAELAHGGVVPGDAVRDAELAARLFEELQDTAAAAQARGLASRARRR